MKPLDWTKPIQWNNGSGQQFPARVVGKDGDNYVIAREFVDRVYYASHPPSGVDQRDGFITNVPPPSLWPAGW